MWVLLLIALVALTWVVWVPFHAVKATNREVAALEAVEGIEGAEQKRPMGFFFRLWLGWAYIPLLALMFFFFSVMFRKRDFGGIAIVVIFIGLIHLIVIPLIRYFDQRLYVYRDHLVVKSSRMILPGVKERTLYYADIKALDVDDVATATCFDKSKVKFPWVYMDLKLFDEYREANGLHYGG